MKRVFLLIVSTLMFIYPLTAHGNYIAPGSVTEGPGDGTSWNQYHASDRFDMMKNPNDTFHFLIGAGGAYILSDVLVNKVHLTKLEAWIASMLIISTIGVVKETYIDNFSSKADVFGWQLGAVTGATTFTILHF